MSDNLNAVFRRMEGRLKTKIEMIFRIGDTVIIDTDFQEKLKVDFTEVLWSEYRKYNDREKNENG